MTAPQSSVRAIPRPCLMLVTDRHLANGSEGLVRSVSAAVEGGVNVVQLREKDLSDDALLPLARELRFVTAGRALFLINDRPRIAIDVEADGVHRGETRQPDAWDLADVSRALAGRSVHTCSAAIDAEANGAAYLVLGTVYPSRSHPGGPIGGIELVRKVCAAVRLPVIGIGGISTDNLAAVIEAGAVGVAVISAILGRPDPHRAASDLREALDTAWNVRHGSRAATGRAL